MSEDVLLPPGTHVRYDGLEDGPEFGVVVLGFVTAAEPRLNANGDISEIAVTLEGDEVILRAGEVIEHADSTFAFCDLAGSILVFLSAQDRSRVELNKTLSWS